VSDWPYYVVAFGTIILSVVVAIVRKRRKQ